MQSLLTSAVPSHQEHAVKLLISKTQYISCHIQVPDLPGRVAAVQINGNYYSMFKPFSDAQRVIKAALKMGYRGDRPAIGFTPRGFIMWLHEPQAQAACNKSGEVAPIRSLHGPADCFLLPPQGVYQFCTLRVPDMAGELPGLRMHGKCYSLFRQEVEAEKVLETAAKLARRGDETVILSANMEYIIYVWEPTAQHIS